MVNQITICQKKLVKRIRSIALNFASNSKEKENFMESNITLNDVISISKECDKYPVHFYMHLCLACEIIGYKNPNEEIRTFFKKYYCILVEEVHLNIETEEEFNNNLKD